MALLQETKFNDHPYRLKIRSKHPGKTVVDISLINQIIGHIGLYKPNNIKLMCKIVMYTCKIC